MLQERNSTLMFAIQTAAKARIHDFHPQELAGLVWSFASMAEKDVPLMCAITNVVGRKLDSQTPFRPREIVGMAWSFAALRFSDERMLSSIAMASMSIISQFIP
mmetsp:Transcript_74646/g.132038  ORF Transcript_74646/g.132038 Transcript_74646/m.132038 type:complete len:104 (+) Transcript_74646:446-757(+)